MNLFHLVCASLVVLAVGACRSTPTEQRCRSIASTYFYDEERVDLDDTLRDFQTYDLETQYVIFTCATQYMHPPFSEFTRPFAQGGQRTAEFLAARLRERPTDRATIHILEVYVEMRRQNTFDVTTEADTMILLSGRVDQISDPHWRGFGRELLADLERNA